MARRRVPVPADPRIDAISRRIRDLVRERVDPEASLDQIETQLLAIQGEVLAGMAPPERFPTALSAPTPPRRGATPRRR